MASMDEDEVRHGTSNSPPFHPRQSIPVRALIDISRYPVGLTTTIQAMGHSPPRREIADRKPDHWIVEEFWLNPASPSTTAQSTSCNDYAWVLDGPLRVRVIVREVLCMGAIITEWIWESVRNLTPERLLFEVAHQQCNKLQWLRRNTTVGVVGGIATIRKHPQHGIAIETGYRGAPNDDNFDPVYSWNKAYSTMEFTTTVSNHAQGKYDSDVMVDISAVLQSIPWDGLLAAP
ncbi:hypothetical protein F4678DRAFT_456950 [Xylaria arbuscula]|nr:hypothetical protein F4678DRAFT_456950 [Xylaria arbuscula]